MVSANTTTNDKTGAPVEYFDSPEELDSKVTQLAEWVMQSQQMLCYTGAGISAQCGADNFNRPSTAHMALVQLQN